MMFQNRDILLGIGFALFPIVIVTLYARERERWSMVLGVLLCVALVFISAIHGAIDVELESLFRVVASLCVFDLIWIIGVSVARSKCSEPRIVKDFWRRIPSVATLLVTLGWGRVLHFAFIPDMKAYPFAGYVYGILLACSFLAVADLIIPERFVRKKLLSN